MCLQSLQGCWTVQDWHGVEVNACFSCFISALSKLQASSHKYAEGTWGKYKHITAHLHLLYLTSRASAYIRSGAKSVSELLLWISIKVSSPKAVCGSVSTFSAVGRADDSGSTRSESWFHATTVSWTWIRVCSLIRGVCQQNKMILRSKKWHIRDINQMQIWCQQTWSWNSSNKTSVESTAYRCVHAQNDWNCIRVPWTGDTTDLLAIYICSVANSTPQAWSQSCAMKADTVQAVTHTLSTLIVAVSSENYVIRQFTILDLPYNSTKEIETCACSEILSENTNSVENPALWRGKRTETPFHQNGEFNAKLLESRIQPELRDAGMVIAYAHANVHVLMNILTRVYVRIRQR